MYKYKNKKYYREDDFLVAYYSDVLKDNPASPLFLPLADIYFKNNRLSHALQTCQTGLEKIPHYHSAHFLLAQIFHALGEEGKSEEELERVLQNKPENLAALTLLADISLKKGSIEKARELYKRLIELNPKDKKALNALSHLPSVSSKQDVTSEKQELNTKIPHDMRETIETGTDVLYGKHVEPQEEEVNDDDLLMPPLLTSDELRAQLDDFEKPEMPEGNNLPDEAMSEEEVLEEENISSLEGEIEHVSEEEIFEVIDEDELAEEITAMNEGATETEVLFELKEPEESSAPDDIDEEELPPLPKTFEEDDIEKVVSEDDFSSSLILDDRPLEEIKTIFEKEDEKEPQMSTNPNSEIIEKKQKVINRLETWLKKMD